MLIVPPDGLVGFGSYVGTSNALRFKRPTWVYVDGELRSGFALHINDTARLDPQNGLAPGDPARMATRIIESVEVEPAPLRMVLGSQALDGTLTALRKRIAGFEAQTALAASTDFLPGE